MLKENDITTLITFKDQKQKYEFADTVEIDSLKLHGNTLHIQAHNGNNKTVQTFLNFTKELAIEDLLDLQQSIDDVLKEKWHIPSYKGRQLNGYLVSDYGRFYSDKTQRTLTPKIDQKVCVDGQFIKFKEIIFV